MSEKIIAGTCVFCGQSFIDAEGNTQKEKDESATMKCTCGAARRYREKKRQVAMANCKIEEFFRNEKIEEYGFEAIKNDETIKLLKKCVELCADEKIEQAQIKINQRTIATILATSNEKIKVIRTEKKQLKTEE